MNTCTRLWAAVTRRSAVHPPIDLLFVLRHVVAFCCFATASLIVGGVGFLWLVGLYALGIPLYTALTVAVAAAIVLGCWALPARRDSDPHQNGSWEADEQLYEQAARDELNERLERQLALPALRPAHDHHVRPAVPPDPDTAVDGTHAG